MLHFLNIIGYWYLQGTYLEILQILKFSATYSVELFEFPHL